MINITSVNNDSHIFLYDLKFLNETSRSIYCESSVYGDVYRIEKSTKALFRDGSKIADTCEYSVL